MVTSALRLSGLALLAVAATLFALPALRSGADPARADGRPAAAPTVTGTATATESVPTGADAADLEPVRLLARERSAEGRSSAERRPPARPRGYTVARIRAGKSVRLRSKPGGPGVSSLQAHTEFGSRRVLSVAAVRGRWLGVTVPERPNGKLGWVDRKSDAIDRSRVKVSLIADLSQRRVDLRVDGRVVKRLKVAIGRPGSSTPTGRFAVTDKLSGGRYGPYYGCCILALSGHQPNTPAGWKGGNRLAIHGTNSPGTIGLRASAGCLRASDRDLRTLMRRVPVGTPVFVRR